MEIRRKGIEPIVILIVERISALFCFVQQNPDTNQVIFFANKNLKFWKYIVEEEIHEKGLIKVNKVSLINSIFDHSCYPYIFL